jgi:DHA3 family macrolide efflux protein-like MFS transporter
VMFIRSVGGAFHYPAMSASTTLMVPDHFLSRLAGMNQTLQGFVTVFSPPLGALLIGLLPMQGVLAVDIVTAAFAVFPLLFIQIPQPQRRLDQISGKVVQTTYWHDLREGFRYVIGWPGLFGLILLAMILNFLLSPSSALMPLVVTKVFNGGVIQLGWAESIFGVGVIIGGIILSAWGGFKRRIITSFLGVIGIGLGVTLIGLAPANMFYMFLTANFILGFTQVFANGPLHAIFQSIISADMQGRVFSLISAGAGAMMPLSMLVAGPVADWLGVRFWYVMGGVICVLMTVAAVFIPPIINIENNQQKLEQAS